MNLKNRKVFTSKFVGTGPSSYEKIIYRAAVSQNLRNTAIDSPKYGGRFALTLCPNTLPFLFDVMSYAAIFSGRPLLSFLINIVIISLVFWQRRIIF